MANSFVLNHHDMTRREAENQSYALKAISVPVPVLSTKRTYEMLCFYFSGWADEQDLTAHLERLEKTR